MPKAPPPKITYVWSGKTRSSVYKHVRWTDGSLIFRPSAAKARAHNPRARHYARYAGKLHVMATRCNGSPYWRALPSDAKVPGRTRVR